MARVLLLLTCVSLFASLASARISSESTAYICGEVNKNSSSKTSLCYDILKKFDFIEDLALSVCVKTINSSVSDGLDCLQYAGDRFFDENALKVCSRVVDYSSSLADNCLDYIASKSFDKNDLQLCANTVENSVSDGVKCLKTLISEKLDKTIKVRANIPNLMPPLLNASQFMYNLFWGLKVEVNAFKGNSLRKSDARQLRRLEMSIDGSLVSFKAKDNKVTIPPTHPAVIESARLTLAFLTVIDQFREEYDHLPLALTSFDRFSKYSTELRAALGCETLMVCPGSKGISHLANIIDTMAREISAKYGALHVIGDNSNSPFAPANFAKSINTVVLAATRLRAAVDARNGGDAAVDNEIRDFINAWNQAAWQNTLAAIENYGKDLSSDIQPRFKVLMTAAYSLKDYLGNRTPNLEMPDEQVVENIYGVK